MALLNDAEEVVVVHWPTGWVLADDDLEVEDQVHRPVASAILGIPSARYTGMEKNGSTHDICYRSRCGAL